MDTLKSTSILALIIARNPYHIISIQGSMPMSHAQNTYEFEIAEDDPHYDDMVNYSGDMLWVYTYADKESLELDLMEILNQMDLLRGCDYQYFYNVDELDMVLYGATLILEQEKYKPLILAQLQHYQDCFDEEEHAEIIDYYIDLLEEPETLYENAEQTINLFKSFIK